TGKPVPGYNTRIVDEHGRELGTNEIGELIVRGPSAGEGYWNQRAKSRRTFAGEWTHTGDKYQRDADGYYYYCGRTDDLFKVSGMWGSPFDVEEGLVSHEAVLEAAVIGKEDADGLIKPKAFIVLRNGFKADDVLLERLKLHVKDKAWPWKFPRWIELRTALPRTATGKIQRFKLREEDLATLYPCSAEAGGRRAHSIRERIKSPSRIGQVAGRHVAATVELEAIDDMLDQLSSPPFPRDAHAQSRGRRRRRQCVSRCRPIRRFSVTVMGREELGVLEGAPDA